MAPCHEGTRPMMGAFDLIGAPGKGRGGMVSWRRGFGAGMSRREKRTESPDSAAQRTAGDVGIHLWRAAARWRRHAERELADVDLTLAQWLVLDATHALITEMGDAINQSQVAARLEQDRMTVSQVMRALARKGLIDRGPDLLSSAYRIWVTASGIRALARGRERIEAASLVALGRCD